MKRQGDPEHTSPADLAVHLNGSLHLVYQLLHHGHAKPDAVIVSSCPLMLLGKGLKHILFKVLPDADSRIFDHKLAGGGFALTGDLFCLDKHRSVGTVVFESIVDDIHQDLLYMQRISYHPSVFQPHLLKLQADPLLLRLGGQDSDAVLQCVIQVKRLLHRRRSSALQLADLQDVID